jgi:hypothetical protein
MFKLGQAIIFIWNFYMEFDNMTEQ